jgi:SAM-dependent methyltransferase
MTRKKIDLDDAYALKTPEDSVALYRDFAATYDEGFVADTGYVYPREVARVFLEQAGPNDRPVLDIGAGTGLLAERLGGIVTDGIDISAEMLEKAAAKGLYRNRIVADLTKPLEIADSVYGGLISSGTFTHAQPHRRRPNQTAGDPRRQLWRADLVRHLHPWPCRAGGAGRAAAGRQDRRTVLSRHQSRDLRQGRIRIGIRPAGRRCADRAGRFPRGAILRGRGT